MVTMSTQSGSEVIFHDDIVVVESLNIYDIAHALSNLCRFNGHCGEFYSVAQHSVLVSYHCSNNLEGLMHDAPEAYLGDVISPLKKVLGELYADLEYSLARQIQEKYDLQDWDELPDVMEADQAVLAAEVRDLMPRQCIEWDTIRGVEPIQRKIIPLPPLRAREAFLKRFGQLGG